MTFEQCFQTQFDKAINQALQMGVWGAFEEGCTYGVASALIYFGEALLFYVSASLITYGTHTYLQMVKVLNLIVFSITRGATNGFQYVGHFFHLAFLTLTVLPFNSSTDREVCSGYVQLQLAPPSVH
jgi:hypothetical protein